MPRSMVPQVRKVLAGGETSRVQELLRYHRTPRRAKPGGGVLRGVVVRDVRFCRGCLGALGGEPRSTESAQGCAGVVSRSISRSIMHCTTMVGILDRRETKSTRKKVRLEEVVRLRRFLDEVVPCLGDLPSLLYESRLRWTFRDRLELELVHPRGLAVLWVPYGDILLHEPKVEQFSD